MYVHWNTSEYYPVEKVLRWRYKVLPKGKLVLEFYIKWTNNSHLYNCWEAYHHLNAKTKKEADALVASRRGELLVVEKVLMSRIRKRRGGKSNRIRPRLEYYVEWRGHPETDNRWVTKAELMRLKGEALWKVYMLHVYCPAPIKVEREERI